MSSNLDGNLDGSFDATSGGVIQNLDRRSSAAASGIINNRWLLGAKIHFRTATQYLADDFIKIRPACDSSGLIVSRGTVYEGKILNFGYIERSIDAPAAPYRVGDCLIRVADVDQTFRQLLVVQTGMRRLIEIHRISDGALIGSFEITEFQFGDGYVDVRGSDQLSRILKKSLPMLGTRANFPYLAPGLDEFFMPIIFGMQFSSGDNPQGMVRCPHIGPTTTDSSPALPIDRYAVSRHRLLITPTHPIVVYRKLASESEFRVVNSSEYFITQPGQVYFTEPGYYLPTYLDFFEQQELDAEIRIDTCGVDAQYVLDLSKVGQNFTVSQTFDPTRNPMILFSLVFYEAAFGLHIFIDGINGGNFSTIQSLCDSEGYVVDGAITRPITAATFISWWQNCTEIDFFINRYAQADWALTINSDPSRDLLSDEMDFIEAAPVGPKNPVNRIRYRYGLNSATGEWAGTEDLNNTGDQGELGNVSYQGLSDQIELQTIDLPFVSDATMAATIMARRKAWLQLGSFRFKFTVPTPEWFERLELGSLEGITHYGGIAVGGWTNEEFKTLSIRHDLSNLTTQVESIIRTPLEY